MNEQLLQGIIRLYALLAGTDGLLEAERERIAQFLSWHTSEKSVARFLVLLDETVKAAELQKQNPEWLNAETQRICQVLNREFKLAQKYFLYLELLELSSVDGEISESEYRILDSLPAQLNLDPKEVALVKAFAQGVDELSLDIADVLLISSSLSDNIQNAIAWKHDEIEGLIAVLKLHSVDRFFMRYIGSEETLLNGRILQYSMSAVWASGATLRHGKASPIFLTDIRERFSNPADKAPVSLVAKEITYRFPNGKQGLHSISLSEKGGRMIAIMGASGGGKSTLFNVLNGNEKPWSGSVYVNGINLHEQGHLLDGTIGYIPQDDLLNEHLTVFQNLYYAAKFSFSNWPEAKVTEAVEKTLASLNLLEARNTIVGSPLRKTISGGQRKRLNIGMELIRHPSILFVDEPTSGLSSRDSMRIMELLKDLALSGKLVFVIIHQPSPEIFQMFDKLVVLDVGGYMIYYGKGPEAVPYFRQAANLPISLDNSQLSPEEIFDIVEAKVLNEMGEELDERKLSAADWNSIYTQKVPATEPDIEKLPVKHVFRPPSFFKQVWLYLRRDITAKIHDQQYMLINLLEAPLLALLLAVTVRYAPVHGFTQLPYRFHENENIPAYFFMAVIVALFMGMSISAEEILRDRLLLKREKFLHLSRDSYLIAKVLLLFLLSAFHTLTFVLLSDFLLEVNDIGVEFWLVLFSASCCANLMGLILSDTFKNAVTVYILIPLLLIPQLVLGGVVVRFDRLNPWFSNQARVPLLGDVMISRWAYEAIMVAEFKNNRYQKFVFNLNQKLADYQYKRNFLLPTLSSILDELRHVPADQVSSEEIQRKQALLYSEFTKEEKSFSGVQPVANLIKKPLPVSVEDANTLRQQLAYFHAYYNKSYNTVNRELEKILQTPAPELPYDATPKPTLQAVEEVFENKRVKELMTNRLSEQQILVSPKGIVRKADPVYQEPEPKNKWDYRSHFYAPVKHFWGMLFPTEVFNIAVIWIMSTLMAITLRFRLLRKILVNHRR